MSPIVQILIAVIPTVGVIAFAIFSNRSGDKKIDEISRDTSHIIPTTDRSLEYAKENNQYITRTFANQLSKIEENSSFIAKDVELRRLYSDPREDVMMREKMIGNIDRLYAQNGELSEQLAAATAKIEDLQHELEKARAEIKILHSAAHEEEHEV